MRVLIFGGTTEGRELAQRLAEQDCSVVYSAATDYGAETLGQLPGVQVLTGIRPEEEIEDMLDSMDLCIDATHPFAEHISQSIRTACGRKQVKEFRFVREEAPIPETPYLKKLSSVSEVCRYLRQRPGNILLTTGSKDLKQYAALGAQRLYPRVLPAVKSLQACSEAGIPRKNIIAMQGPFSTAMNCCMLRDFDISYMVSKESGRQGGLFQKIEAAEECGVQLLMIQRPEEVIPPSSEEEILAWIHEGQNEEAGEKQAENTGTVINRQDGEEQK
ncbi:MAG: precorrin-6A reductase [Eubacterium sp.]